MFRLCTSEQLRLKIFNTFSSLQLMMYEQFSQLCFLCFYLQLSVIFHCPAYFLSRKHAPRPKHLPKPYVCALRRVQKQRRAIDDFAHARTIVGYFRTWPLFFKARQRSSERFLQSEELRDSQAAVNPSEAGWSNPTSSGYSTVIVSPVKKKENLSVKPKWML